MKIFSCILLFVLVFPILAVTQKSKYVGYKHKGVINGAKLPNGVKDLGGGLLTDEDFGVTRFSKGKKYMLWLEKITDRDTEGVPNWEVKDVLSIKKPKKNQEYFVGLSSPCVQNKKQNLNLIVKTQLLADKTYKILNVWNANTKKAKFEKISNRGVSCEFPATGRK